MVPDIPDSFWVHMPGWIWPVIVTGIFAFFLVQAIKGYESVARLFGAVGAHLHEKATEKAMRRVQRGSGVDVKVLQEEMSNVLDYVKRMETSLTRSSDDLECAIAYLVSDASWHHNVDIILAEHFPAGTIPLPPRVPFSMFSTRWRDGWRPYYTEGEPST